QFFRVAVDRDSQTLRRELVGRSARTIAAAAGIVRPYAIRLIVVPVSAASCERFYMNEKLAPVLSMFSVRDEAAAIALCRETLQRCGAGHTAVIHAAARERIERFAAALPVSRILVNVPAAHGCCGMRTGLDCSMTLGCGTFGGNSTTDNVTHRHL